MPGTRRDVEFASNGATLRGWLYAGDGDGPRPGIVMAHGMTAVREMFLDTYAEAFAAAGLTTLVYDHFGFGASDGEPRQWPAPSVQLQGYRDGVSWLRAQDGVDPERIGLWGSSFSGGHIAVLAAEELPIRCAVAQLPGIVAGGPSLSAATLAAFGQAAGPGGEDTVIPAVSATADGLGLMYVDGAYDWFMRVSAERAPSWRNELRLSALLEPHHPMEHLANTKVPLLLIVAPADQLTPPAAAMERATGLADVEVVEVAGGHFDGYEAGFAATSEPAVAWFTKHLLA
jgi:uncharacterized protein